MFSPSAMRYLGSTEHFAPGKKTARKKSERPEKNRCAKRARKIGQTVLSLGREAQRTKRPRRSRGRMGLEAPRKKTGSVAERKHRTHLGIFFIYSGAKNCCAPNQKNRYLTVAPHACLPVPTITTTFFQVNRVQR